MSFSPNSILIDPVTGLPINSVGANPLEVSVPDGVTAVIDKSGLATESKQDAGNVSLASIDSKLSNSSDSSLTSVAGSAVSVQLLAANPNRKGVVIVNDSTAVLYVALGATASTSRYSYYMKGTVNGEPSHLEVTLRGYTGRIDGIWASATGNARITELI